MESINELFNNVMNEGLAWVSVILGVILSLKYVVRMSLQKSQNNKEVFKELNLYMRKTHIPMGILVVIIGMIHGIFSSQQLLSFNLGTICWIISIILGLNWMYRKILKKTYMWIKYHRILTVLFLVTMVIHTIDVKRTDIIAFKNNIYLNINNNEEIGTTEEFIGEDINGYEFNDGTYEGVANGFGPNLVLEVEIKNNEIKNITITNHNEKNESYYGKPMKEIPRGIIENQTLDVDSISGATYTSNGIVDAVKDALQKAIK